jgi:hypothetical protein
MAFFNDLVRVIAEVEGMDVMTVRGIGIKVREAGLLSKGGRGLSAARMTARDAAALLTAVNGTDLSKDAGEAVKAFHGLVLTFEAIDLTRPAGAPRRNASGPVERVLVRGSTFGDAFEALVAAFIPDQQGRVYFDSEQIVRVTFMRPVRETQIEVRRGPRSRSEAPDVFIGAWFKDQDLRTQSDEIPDRRVSTTISARTLTAVGRILAI